MHSDVIKGNWHQFKGAVKAKWGRLTDDDLEVVAGDAERLAGMLQERYGRARDSLEQDIDALWVKFDSEHRMKHRE